MSTLAFRAQVTVEIITRIFSCYTVFMPTDLSRQDATTSDNDYSLSIEEAAFRYESAGHPRTLRSIQRYCAQGHLDCLRKETPFGEKYMITPASVARHIAQIEELAQTTSRDRSRLDATGRLPFQREELAQEAPTSLDSPRPVATPARTEVRDDEPRHTVATAPDVLRPVAASHDLSSKFIERLEGEVEFLREEISTKNAQIKELTERSRETNLLIGGLQRMLAPLLGSPDPYREKPEDRTV